TDLRRGAAGSTAAEPGALAPPNGSLDPVEPRRVPPHDQVALARRHVGELLRDGLARARPGRVAVRVVARPEDVLEARLVAQLHAGTVLDEGRVALAVPVRARRLGDHRLRPEAVLLEGRVHALEVVRNPADARLDHHEDEARVALADAAEDELRDQLADPHRRERDERLAYARRRVEEARGLHAARPLDVEGERDGRFLERAPERLPDRIAVVRRADGVGEGVDLDAARALPGDAIELGERLIDAAIDGEDGDAHQPSVARLLQLEEPVVVPLRAVRAQLRLVEPARPAAVEDVGPDTVL